jgi:cytochrome P450
VPKNGEWFPSPKSVAGFFLGNVARYAFPSAEDEPYSEHIELAARAQGRPQKVRILSNVDFWLTSPEDIQHVLIHNAPNYTKSQGYKVIERIVGVGLVTMFEEDDHTRHRREVSPAFAPATLKRIANLTVREHAAQLIKDLKALAQENAGAPTDDLPKLLKQTALYVICEAAFHTDAAQTKDISYYFLDTMALGFSVLRRLPGVDAAMVRANRKIAQNRRSVEAFVDTILRREAERGDGAVATEHNAIIDYLTHSKLLSRTNIMDHSLTFMFAGFDTSSNGLAWITALLAQHPDEQEKLYEELCGVMPKDAFCELDNLKSCRYLLNIVQESLRLCPPVAEIGREARTDDVLAGSKTFVPKGMGVGVPILGLHYLKEIWGDDAHKFRPDRWDDPTLKDRVGECGFMPFGLGKRNCIGKDFAMNEMLLLTAAVFRNLKVTFPPGQAFPKRVFGIVVAPAPYKVLLECRDH